MPPVRARGRRTAPGPKVQSTAEREIRALQQERLDLEQAVEDKLVELAKHIDRHMQEGVATSDIASWLTSPKKPNGVSRQQVYKLVAERVDGKALNPVKPKLTDKPRPRPQAKSKPKPRPVSRSRPTRS